MHPVILSWGLVTIYSYGLMIALGILVSFSFLRKQAAKENFSSELLFDLTFFIILSGLIGSRVFYILEHLEYFTGNIWEVFKIWEGGLTYYGALIGAILYLSFFCIYQKLSFLRLADLYIPYVALAHSFGRIGCFLNGCCFGKSSTLPWAVKFPFSTFRVHPAQIYSSLFLFLLFFVLRYIHRRRKLEGETLLGYLLLYPTGRFLLDFLRGDLTSIFLGLTLSQLISMGSIFFATLAYLFFFRRKIGV